MFFVIMILLLGALIWFLLPLPIRWLIGWALDIAFIVFVIWVIQKMIKNYGFFGTIGMIFMIALTLFVIGLVLMGPSMLLQFFIVHR